MFLQLSLLFAGAPLFEGCSIIISNKGSGTPHYYSYVTIIRGNTV